MLEKSDQIIEGRKRLKSILNDSITKILLKNSSLTEIQFESLIIDMICDYLIEKDASWRDKLNLRLNRERLTRGAYNRTLTQARMNVVKSIYTLFLLAYTGLFDDPRLEPFIELGNRIKSYMEDLKNAKRGHSEEDIEKITKLLDESVKELIESFVKKKNSKYKRD
ncbi:MAG: hypothetical protein QW265_01610 [Candidatus Bathyarchaeia archaeon]